MRVTRGQRIPRLRRQQSCRAVEVTDYVYKAAGVDAIFPGSPIERCFRDMHTLSQQIQARDAHHEAVGQVLWRAA